MTARGPRGPRWYNTAASETPYSHTRRFTALPGIPLHRHCILHGHNVSPSRNFHEFCFFWWGVVPAVLLCQIYCFLHEPSPNSSILANIYSRPNLNILGKHSWAQLGGFLVKGKIDCKNVN